MRRALLVLLALAALAAAAGCQPTDIGSACSITPDHPTCEVQP